MMQPASEEFVALCRSQVALLIQIYGASLGAVYLTDDLSDTEPQAELVPLVIYPDDAASWGQSSSWQLSAEWTLPSFRLPAEETSQSTMSPASAALSLRQPRRVVVPIMHNSVMLGLLVAAREQRHWSPREHDQLEQMAHTLAMACVLDQRAQWLAMAGGEQRLLQGQQYQTFANLLHQFRNPLTTLRTLGKLLLKRLLPEDTNRQIADSIVQQSDRLEELLQQFDGAIDLGEAALETETSPFKPSSQLSLPPISPMALPPAQGLGTGQDLQLQPCWVLEILNPIVGAIAGTLEERQLHLQVQIPAELPPVNADPMALREVFSNLIDNALKYTPAQGQIRISVQRLPAQNPNQQQIIVSDTGPGIPCQDLPHIFERRYRGVQARTDIPGTGLGLNIAQSLLAQMQGDLQVFSPALDPSTDPQALPGSTFVVSLPEC
ncbi:histidine kinase [Synechococcales cyanobacterium C]|uniref:histidine kinase n=2 Tax=Petrachloros TaxID=2918834 RepID=A0A8K1ZVI5_9CYAN|nr:histidine kinase [Petrachloros mirabilis ULC683]